MGPLTIMSTRSNRTGSFTSSNPDLANAIEKLKPEIAEQYGISNPEDIEVHSFKSEIIAGIDYTVKVKVGDTGEILKVKIHQGLQETGSKFELGTPVGGPHVVPKRENRKKYGDSEHVPKKLPFTREEYELLQNAWRHFD